MECVFSSIAWNPAQAAEIARVLREHGHTGIEGAPNLFDRPFAELETRHIATVRAFWERESLPVRAMQALLFGKPELRLFGSNEERAALADSLRVVFRVAGQLGAGPLVFGSPHNRRRGGMPADVAFDTAVTFFRTLAPFAATEGCTLCMEANAADYGCDFITTHAEAAELVAAVNAEGFGLQVDTGVMQMNGEAPAELLASLQRTGLMPRHVHASQPFLAPVDGNTFHADMAAALAGAGYTGLVSVEMKNPASLPVLIETARCIQALYGVPA